MKNSKIGQSLFPFFSAFGIVIFVDQLTKWWARGQGIVVTNPGVSFGFGSRGSVLFFLLLILFILSSVFFLFKDIWKKNLAIFALLSGAAFSNVLDRVWWGGVQDFLPIRILRLQNNLADWVIFGCMVWVGWKVLLDSRSKKI